MNRADRRKNKIIQNKVPVTQAQFEHAVRTESDKQNRLRRQELIGDMICIYAMVMYDEFGFGKKRQMRLMDKIQTHLECLGNNMVNTQDIRNWINEKFDIEFTLK